MLSCYFNRAKTTAHEARRQGGGSDDFQNVSVDSHFCCENVTTQSLPNSGVERQDDGEIIFRVVLACLDPQLENNETKLNEERQCFQNEVGES